MVAMTEQIKYQECLALGRIGLFCPTSLQLFYKIKKKSVWFFSKNLLVSVSQSLWTPLIKLGYDDFYICYQFFFRFKTKQISFQ